MGLRVAEARLGDRQMPRVRLQVGIDRVELHVREVVGLDRVRELRRRSPGSARARPAPAPASPRPRVGGRPSNGRQGTATKIAVRSVRIAGAFRLLELTTLLPSARTYEAPRWEPGPSQVRHPSSLSGQRQGSNKPKTGVNSPAYESQTMTPDGEKLLGCPPREDAFDERCGAPRGRFHGLPAGCLGAGRPGCGCLRPEPASGAVARARHLARDAGVGRHPRALRPRGRAHAGRAARRRASRRGKRWSSASALLHGSGSRSPATPCASPRLGSPISSGRCTSTPARSDPLAILLGAESLEEVLTGLDSLDRAAGENARIIEQARSSRRKLGTLDGRLAAQAAELARLGAAADARARTLASVAETRKRFVAGLRHQQGLNAARIASIEAQARTADAPDDRRCGHRAGHVCGAGAGDERADDHRQRHRLFAPRAHRDRNPDRPGRRGRRSRR